MALGAAGFFTSGTPKTFQNLSVSSAAAVATVQPSGLWKRGRVKTVTLGTRIIIKEYETMQVDFIPEP